MNPGQPRRKLSSEIVKVIIQVKTQRINIYMHFIEIYSGQKAISGAKGNPPKRFKIPRRRVTTPIVNGRKVFQPSSSNLS